MAGIPLPVFDEASATEAALARTAGEANPRLIELVSAVVRHSHALMREVRPTAAEWMAALRFLTETGQACTEARQEFILLSDVLGVSMLVDAVNGEAGGTESTVLGPFDVAGAPLLPAGASPGMFAHDRALLPQGRDGNLAFGATPLDLPVLAVGADHVYGDGALNTMRRVARDPQGRIAWDCGHYVPEERPAELSAALIAFFRTGRPA